MILDATIPTLYPEIFPGRLGQSLAGGALSSDLTIVTDNKLDLDSALVLDVCAANLHGEVPRGSNALRRNRRALDRGLPYLCFVGSSVCSDSFRDRGKIDA